MTNLLSIWQYDYIPVFDYLIHMPRWWNRACIHCSSDNSHRVRTVWICKQPAAHSHMFTCRIHDYLKTVKRVYHKLKATSSIKNTKHITIPAMANLSLQLALHVLLSILAAFSILVLLAAAWFEIMLLVILLMPKKNGVDGSGDHIWCK